FIHIAIKADLIEVETSRGSVQGFDHDFGSNKTQRFFGYGQVFLGIPYAKPPLGERRFTLPEDICQYNESGQTHNATYYRPRCYQGVDAFDPAESISEDCLYLNVITPAVNGTFPVMVFIHGGTFTTGGADIYHWKGAIRNLVSRGIVVVTIQYRLGLIGFFTTYTETFPPNRGLYDQILALRWVNQEISSFGGDPNSVTFYGQSAGGVSVSDLSLSPLARGLFHQTIQTSGSAIQELETMTDRRGSIHQDRAMQVCNINSTNWGSPEKDNALLKCLLQASPQELIAFDFSNAKMWNVALDGAILPDYPEKLAANRPKYPALIGDVLEEFAMFMPDIFSSNLSSFGPHTTLDILNRHWPGFDNVTAKEMTDFVNDAFSDGTLPADDDHVGWAKLVTDDF
ncbi:hypothetical protein PFISCL1PPCAC_7448, partial [Pristionchus fissidentatus]